MCGIVAYIGQNEAFPVLIKGLQLLEYRGYDSTGVATLNGTLNLYKQKGKVQDLLNFTADKKTDGTVGIGHTRWATHGQPDNQNAHPHVSHSGRLSLVHNGIIENYATLKTTLQNKGYHFSSQTDTEVLAHLIEDIQTEQLVPLDEAVRLALQQVRGSYAVVIMDKDDKTRLIAARKSSPLAIGICKNGEFIVASDAMPIVEYTNDIIYLDDEEIALIDLINGLKITTLDNKSVALNIQRVDLSPEMFGKGKFDTYMLKEIYEQPSVLRSMINARLDPQYRILFDELLPHMDKFLKARRIIITACGTSWHAGLVAKYLFENLARITVDVEYASEFRYRNPVLFPDDIVIAISQSGETADTLAAIELVKEQGIFTYSLVNAVGSSIARLTDAVSYLHVGPEIGVASTKAFTGQVTLLSLLAIHLGYMGGKIPTQQYIELTNELEKLPQILAKTLICDAQTQKIAYLLKNHKNALYLGRGYNFPVALEGALKLKEISYIHAEGYPAAEMKHGPIALIDENMPLVVLATNESQKEKIASNMHEIKARKGIIIAIVDEHDTQITQIADYVIVVPAIAEPFSPIVSVIPLQLLSYHTAVALRCNVDQPRNLAKSVTVE